MTYKKFKLQIIIEIAFILSLLFLTKLSKAADDNNSSEEINNIDKKINSKDQKAIDPQTELLNRVRRHKELKTRSVEPRQLGREARFKVWTFQNDVVYKFTGHYLHPTYIEFEEDEDFNTIASPKPDAWQIIPNKNRLFLRPIKDDADTTAIVMTNKRVYFFELHAEEAESPFSPDLTFFIKFKYPQASEAEGDANIIRFNTANLPDLSKPERYNFNYTMAGEETIAPIKVFDDGEFTYLQFRSKNARLPAIFAVDNQGFESVVNYRVIGDYIIVETMAKQFTLRNGPDILCVFNEMFARGR